MVCTPAAPYRLTFADLDVDTTSTLCAQNSLAHPRRIPLVSTPIAPDRFSRDARIEHQVAMPVLGVRTHILGRPAAPGHGRTLSRMRTAPQTLRRRFLASRATLGHPIAPLIAWGECKGPWAAGRRRLLLGEIEDARYK